jgi:iron complex outermembrane receptor protein
VGLRYRGAKLWGHLEATRVASQDRIAPIETRTAGHTLLSAALGYRWFAASTVHEAILRGTNLSDELALNHVSRFKEEVPLPGRDISLSYRLIF